jgi:hypothetical protein
MPMSMKAPNIPTTSVFGIDNSDLLPRSVYQLNEARINEGECTVMRRSLEIETIYRVYQELLSLMRRPWRILAYFRDSPLINLSRASQ